MCVTIVAQDARPSAALIRAAVRTNRDGNGLAWIEHGHVAWIKGLSDQAFLDAVARAPLPFIAHARIASAGGIVPALCHPFAVDKTASAALDGSAKAVLFHNGHWSDWKNTLLDAVTHQSKRMPKGPWSDSRAMAWLAFRYGDDALELLPDSQRVAVLEAGVSEPIRMFGKGWSKVVDGLFVSNTLWMAHLPARKSGARDDDDDDVCSTGRLLDDDGPFASAAPGASAWKVTPPRTVKRR